MIPLDGERVTYLPALLAGRTFTHRLTDAEVAYGFVGVGTDLYALAELTEDPGYQRLSDGSPQVEVYPAFDDDLRDERGVPDSAMPDVAWMLPRDTLGTFTAGDLVAVTVRPEGFQLDSATTTQPPADLAERLTAAITREAADGPALLDSVVWELCADDPELFADPLPPLSELLDGHGFVYDGAQVALPGFDILGWRAERRREQIQRLHGIGEDAALAVLVLEQLHASADALLELASKVDDLSNLPTQEPVGAEDEGEIAGEQTEEAIHAALRFLADPDVAEALAVETMGAESDGAAALGMLAESLEARAPRSARPALRWLRGKALATGWARSSRPRMPTPGR